MQRYYAQEGTRSTEEVFFSSSIVSTNMKYCWEHEEEIKHHKFAFPPSHSGILWKFTFYLFFFFWWLHGRRMMSKSRCRTFGVKQRLFSSRVTDLACFFCSRSFKQVQNLSFEVSKEVSLHNQRICEEKHGLDVVKRWYFDWVCVLFCQHTSWTDIELVLIFSYTRIRNQRHVYLLMWETRFSSVCCPIRRHFNTNFCDTFLITFCLDNTER